MSERRRPFEVSEALYPFGDHWFECEGTAMHYVDHGDGPPVVMLHGNPTWSFLYREVIGHLGGDVRSLAPDYPGFGFSDHPPGYGYTPEEHAEWVLAWLKALDTDPFVLVIQDWGGPIGLWVAECIPEKVAGLVILNTWAWPPDLAMQAFSFVMGGPLGPWLHLEKNVFADKIVKNGIHTRKSKPAEVFEAYTAPFPDRASRMGTYVFPKAIRESADWLAEIERDLPRLADKPREMVWAMRDPAFGREAFIRKWLEIFPHTPVNRLRHASHYLQEDQPKAIAEAIERVIQKVGS